MTATRGLGTVGCACPPWEHNTVPPTASPDGPVGVTWFKLHPHSGTNLWSHVSTFQLTGQWHTRRHPGGRRDAANIRHRDHDASDLQRINVIDHRAPINAVVLRTFFHTVTLEMEEPTPPRARVKLCLYSPRLMLCVTLFT